MADNNPKAGTDEPARKSPRRLVDSVSYELNDTVGLASCVRCDFWHAEVVVNLDDNGLIGEVRVREWHEGTCPVLDEWPER